MLSSHISRNPCPKTTATKQKQKHRICRVYMYNSSLFYAMFCMIFMCTLLMFLCLPEFDKTNKVGNVTRIE